jgi:hypothetical protein
VDLTGSAARHSHGNLVARVAVVDGSINEVIAIRVGDVRDALSPAYRQIISDTLLLSHNQLMSGTLLLPYNQLMTDTLLLS